MMDCKALVLCHVNYKAKDGKDVQRTKLLISLKDFGCYETTIPLDNSLQEFSVINVRVTYQYGKFLVDSIVK